MELARPSQSLEGRAVLFFRLYLKMSAFKISEHDGKYIDIQLNMNYFVFLLSCLAVKSNNMLTLASKELFWQLHWLLPKGHDYLEECKYPSRENTNAHKKSGALNHFSSVEYPEIRLQYRLEVRHYARTSNLETGLLLLLSSEN